MSFEFLRNKRTKIIFLSLFWGVLSLLLLLWLCCPAWLQRHFSPIAACSSDNSEQAVDSIGLHSLQVDKLLRAPRNIEALVAGRTSTIMPAPFRISIRNTSPQHAKSVSLRAKIAMPPHAEPTS